MDKQYISRRDLLKLAALFPVSMTVQPLAKHLNPVSSAGQNVIIMVFDAWSAKHVPLYGYPRNTMPNLEKFAEKAIVYHNHYASSNYTIPGTASLLTGVNPWQHRAFNLGGLISKEFADKHIFSALSATHKTLGYSQNIYADQLVAQGGKYLGTHLPFGNFNSNNNVVYDDALFKKDEYIAFSAYDNTLLHPRYGVQGTLFAGLLKLISNNREAFLIEQKYGSMYKSVMPDNREIFNLADVIDGFIKVLQSLTEPSLLYFHFYTPHSPYTPYKKDYELLKKDKYIPIAKPIHPLITGPSDQDTMNILRLEYDAYLASWDSELSRLFNYFEDSKIRENSHIFITSDHGEEFERGHVGHREKMMYEPLLKIPLIVTTPGLTKRVDINSITTNIDILPTITSLTNTAPAEWAVGEVLPGLGGKEQPTRKLFTLDAELNAPHSIIKQYSLSLHNENFKMIQYQYKEYQGTELYDLANDPEELNDLYPSKPAIAERMEKAMNEKMNEINAPFVSD